MYYPPAIKEVAPFSSEVRDASEEAEAEAASLGAVLAITSPEDPAKESEPSGAAETSEGQNLDAPLKTVESTGDAPVSHANKPILLVEPLQAVPLGEGSKDLETSPAQLSKGGAKTRLKEWATQGSSCFVFVSVLCVCVFLFIIIILYIYILIIIIIIIWDKGVCCNEALLNE